MPSGRRTVLAIVLAFLALAPSARADEYGERVAAEVERTNVYINSGSYTPPIYTEWSTFCAQHVKQRDWVPSALIQSRWTNVPLPCYFKSSPGTDHEALLRWRGSRRLGQYEYYEFWGMVWGRYDGVYGWRAKWGGAANYSELLYDPVTRVRTWPRGMGVQASGITFLDTVMTVAELQRGYVTHPIGLEVPEACGTYRWPATRTDGWGTMSTNPRCLPYGLMLKLPTDTDISYLSRLAQIIGRAAKEHGFIVSDQTRWTVAMRAENWHRPYAPWGSTNPYDAIYGCPDAFSWRCYPDKFNNLRGFPWAKLYAVN